jgi:hypothetical protein
MLIIDIWDILLNYFESWGYVYTSFNKTVYVHPDNVNFLKCLLKEHGLNDYTVLQGKTKKY